MIDFKAYMLPEEKERPVLQLRSFFFKGNS